MSKSERLVPGSIIKLNKTRDTYHCKAMINTDTTGNLGSDKYDLSIFAIEHVCNDIIKEYSPVAVIPTQLIASESISLVAGRVAQKYNLTVILLKSVPCDYWALVFDDGAITIDCEGA